MKDVVGDNTDKHIWRQLLVLLKEVVERCLECLEGQVYNGPKVDAGHAKEIELKPK